MSRILVNPLFLLGLLVRVLAIVVIVPHAVTEWYGNFLHITAQHLSFNPWGEFLATGGTKLAFPYGYMMWLVFLPSALVCQLFGLDAHVGYSASLLLIDICLLFVLRKLFDMSDRILLVGYWLSPIIIFATYWLGFNDIVPIFFLCCALYSIRQLKITTAGVFSALAISAKLSMILAIPFFCIYLIRNRAMRRLQVSYLKGLLLASFGVFVPFLFYHEGLEMLAGNPEMNKVYQFVLLIGTSYPVYLLPAIYSLMLYLTWRINRISFELFNILLGLSFFMVVLLTPASMGWFVWIVPLFLLYQKLSDKKGMIFVAIFSILYVIMGFLTAPSPVILGYDIVSPYVVFILGVIGMKGISLMHTLFVTLGIILVLHIWRDAVFSNNYFRYSRVPFIIGIAGDSGSGKDTLAASIEGLFGAHSVTHLSGDDYHLWDRQKPMWQVMTHLNPRANDLEQYASDLIALSDNKPVYSRHYDHKIGKMTHPRRVESNNYIIASGLHALYSPILRKCYSLSIYLDLDEKLRRFFKIKRDVDVRGHQLEKVLSSISSREADAAKFIRPQSAHADLILSVQQVNPNIELNISSPELPRMKLCAQSKCGLNTDSLVRVLVGLCGLYVDTVTSSDTGSVELTIEGDVTKDDIANSAYILCPQIKDFLDIMPRWRDGIHGLIQLVTLVHIDQTLRSQLI